MKLLSTIIVMLLLWPLPAHAQATSSASAGSTSSRATVSLVNPADTCTNAINNRVAREQRIYRAVLFGRPRAEDEQLGSTRYDQKGNPWIKMEQDEWVTQSPGFESTRWGDAQIDRQTEWEGQYDDTVDPTTRIRRGIFETRKSTTSELIPPILQSYRAFQCRARAVCDVVWKSQNFNEEDLDENGLFPAGPKNCDVLMPPIDECKLANLSTLEKMGNVGTGPAVKSYCDRVVDELLTREKELLKLTVTYDASYRSLLQFAGSFDSFARKFRADLFGPIQQSLSLVTHFARIPCFLSQCNE